MFVWLNHQFYENHLALFVAMVFCKRFFSQAAAPAPAEAFGFIPANISIVDE
jgi:hypothetical protein